MGLERINQIRKAKGMSVDDLCERSGVAKGTLSKITAGITKKPRIQTVQAIAKALNVSMEEFDDQPDQGRFTMEETGLVEKYRRLDARGRSVVTVVLEHELNTAQEDGEGHS